MNDLKPRVVLVTGSSKGIGKAISEHYLTLGDIVIGCSRGDASITKDNYFHFSLDVSVEKDVVKTIRHIKSRFGQIDVLINNAGIASMNHILTTPLNVVEKIIRTNFIGTYLFLREVSKVMMKAKFGRIVNFTTVASPLRLEGESIYASSKAAIENLTQTAAKELAVYGITINGIGPTPIETDLIKAVPKKKIEELLEKQSIKRLGSFDDVANVIDFFVDSKSDYITGQIIYLGGVHN